MDENPSVLPDGPAGQAAASEPPAAGSGRRRSSRTLRSILVQLLVTTLGLLIALSIDGLVDRRRQHTLVAEARATLAREIAENKRDIDGELAAVDKRDEQISQAMRLVSDLRARGKSTVTSFSLDFKFAELRDAGWQSADRTGALSYMPYAEVASYARVYALQELFVSYQRRLIDRVAAALAVAADLPTQLPAKDLDAFRQQLLALRADVMVEAQLGNQLSKLYGEMAKR